MLLTYWLRRLKEVGPVTATKIVSIVLEGIWFDWRNGTDTFRRVPLKRLVTGSANKDHAAPYDPSPVSSIKTLLRELRPGAEDTFVDFGSGKGLVLLLAAGCGFNRVIGVEFSAELCAVARQNAAVYARRHPALCPVEIVECDAAQFAIRNAHTFFYFFNPFDEAVLAPVWKRIVESYRESPRRLVVIYSNPLHRRVLDTLGPFRLQGEKTLRSRTFLIYEARAPVATAAPARSL